MHPTVEKTLRDYILLSGFLCYSFSGLVCYALTNGAAPLDSSSPTHGAMDAKEAHAWRVQVEQRKLIIAYAASDFEKSLHEHDLANCERQLDQSATLLVNGVEMSSCKELMDSRPGIPEKHQKLKLHNEVVEFAHLNSEAGVSLDLTPEGEHHILKLRQIGDHWLVTSLTSTRTQ
jgi:hypothetical protein